MRKKWLAALVCLLLVVGMTLPTAAMEATRETARDYIEGVIVHEMARGGVSDAQSLVNTALAERAGVDAEWYLIALSQYDTALALDGYADALEKYLGNVRVPSVSTRQKYVLSLVACGRENTAFVRDTLSADATSQGVMGAVFGLHLANNGLPTVPSTDELIEALAACRLSDGGYAITGERANADVTAMVLHALAAHAEREDVALLIEAGLACLSDLQREDGGFESYGVTNAESAAQVVIALCALGIDARGDDRFIKNGASPMDALLSFALPSGGFAHEAGGTVSTSATSQALCALVAYVRAGELGRFDLYRFDGVDYDESTIPAAPVDDSHTAPEEGVDVRVWISLLVVIAALSVAFALARKGKGRDAVALLIAAALIVGGIWLLQIRSVEDYYGDTSPRGEIVGSVSVQVRCDVLDAHQRPAGADAAGVLLSLDVALGEGESVLDVLLRATATQRVPVQTSGGYVVGIGALGEFDYGAQSGWVYAVDGVRSSQSAQRYLLTGGERVVWHYTLTLGEDFKEEK